MWTNRTLTEYIKENAPEEYDLSHIANGTVSKILRKSRIDMYFEEINKEPVEFIWEYKMDEMPGV
jgi:hypothetical protein